MRSTFAIALLSLLMATPPASAKTAWEQHVPDAEKIGSGRMTYMVWNVYDATLFAPNGDWSPNKPFALTLSYLRSLNGKDIAHRSVEEIRKQGFQDEVKLAAWYSRLKDVFPDVKNGTTLTGVYTPNAHTRFYHNGKEIGTIYDPEFGKYFFGIWLAKTTPAPELRRKLLGRS